MLCTECREKPVDRDGLCFRCRVATVGFTFRSAHLGRASFHESTVEREKRDLFAHAREHNLDIEKAH